MTTDRGMSKKSGQTAAKIWISRASTEQIVNLAGCVFEYGLTLQDLAKEQGFDFPPSADVDFSWGFFKQVKSHVYSKMHKRF